MTNNDKALQEEIAITLAGDDLGLTADEVRNEWEGGEFSITDYNRHRAAARTFMVAWRAAEAYRAKSAITGTVDA